MLLLQIPAGITFLALVWHALHHRGWVGALFMGLYLPLMFAKTWADQHFMPGGRVDYLVGEEARTVLGVAPVVVVGWVFGFYCSWSIAEILLSRWPRHRNRLWPLLGLTAIINALVSLSIETTGIAMDWWSWADEGRDLGMLPLWTRFDILVGPYVSWLLVTLISLFPWFTLFHGYRSLAFRLGVIAAWMVGIALMYQLQLGLVMYYLGPLFALACWFIPGGLMRWPVRPAYLDRLERHFTTRAPAG